MGKWYRSNKNILTLAKKNTEKLLTEGLDKPQRLNFVDGSKNGFDFLTYKIFVGRCSHLDKGQDLQMFLDILFYSKNLIRKLWKIHLEFINLPNSEPDIKSVRHEVFCVREPEFPLVFSGKIMIFPIKKSHNRVFGQTSKTIRKLVSRRSVWCIYGPEIGLLKPTT